MTSSATVHIARPPAERASYNIPLNTTALSLINLLKEGAYELRVDEGERSMQVWLAVLENPVSRAILTFIAARLVNRILKSVFKPQKSQFVQEILEPIKRFAVYCVKAHTIPGFKRYIDFRTRKHPENTSILRQIWEEYSHDKDQDPGNGSNGRSASTL